MKIYFLFNVINCHHFTEAPIVHSLCEFSSTSSKSLPACLKSEEPKSITTDLFQHLGAGLDTENQRRRSTDKQSICWRRLQIIYQYIQVYT